MHNWIETYTGRRVDLLKPSMLEISIIDIAHGLSNAPRFSGQQKSTRSVAEHSVTVSEEIERLVSYGVFLPAERAKEMALKALLHDASEAYICDIPHPLKQHLPDYKAAEAELQGAIFDAFNLSPLTGGEYDLLKEVDESQHSYELNNPSDLTATQAKILFLERFLELTAK